MKKISINFGILMFFLTLHLTSCMPVMMLVYGLHQPRYVPDDKVIKFYKHLGLDNEIYRVKNYAEANRKEFRYLGNSMPEVLLFNSTGQLTKFELDCSGRLDSIVQLSTADIDNMAISSAEETVQRFIEDTYVINSFSNEGSQFKAPLYVVKFAEYAGLLNKDNVPELVGHLSSRTDVHYIVLNMDYTVKN